MNYVIRSKSERDDDGCFLFWSNTQGWVNIGSELAVYDKSELERFTLPMGGHWVAANVMGSAPELLAACALVANSDDDDSVAYLIKACAHAITETRGCL